MNSSKHYTAAKYGSTLKFMWKEFGTKLLDNVQWNFGKCHLNYSGSAQSSKNNRTRGNMWFSETASHNLKHLKNLVAIRIHHFILQVQISDFSNGSYFPSCLFCTANFRGKGCHLLIYTHTCVLWNCRIIETADDNEQPRNVNNDEGNAQGKNFNSYFTINGNLLQFWLTNKIALYG